jgi:hypothetical protein
LAKKHARIDQPLQAALREFQNSLTPSQKAQLLELNTAPDAAAVITFTAKVDEENAKRSSRCVASRLHDFLQSVQQFSSIVDTFGSSNSGIAALVWGSIKFTILVGLLQLVFMILNFLTHLRPQLISRPTSKSFLNGL